MSQAGKYADCEICGYMAYQEAADEELKALRSEVGALREALTRIQKRGYTDCRCDRGYPGGCGCGNACADIAEDALADAGEGERRG